MVDAAWPYAAALWLIAILTWALLARAPTERPLAAVAVTVLAVAYAGALPAFLLAIRHHGHRAPELGRRVAGLLSAGGHLGVRHGRDVRRPGDRRAPKLAPTVSPGKTRSGSIAGVVGGLVVAPLFAAGVFPRVGLDVPLWQLLVIAAVLGVIGQVGDLAESLFKREAGVKDSSHLIPGHGGVLDRLDSLYFVIPAAAALYRLFGSSGD